MDWSCLPDVLILEIYSYLNDVDRLHMSYTCKRYSRLFNTPVLWRIRRIRFVGTRANATAKREIEFFNTLGKHVRSLKISFGVPSLRTVKNISNSAENFLKHLIYCPQLRITEFVLDNLNFQHHWHFWISRNKIIGAVCRLLRRLRHLRKVNLLSCRASLPEGCRLLEALGRGYGHKTIKTFFSDDLFQSNLIPTRHTRYVNAMSAFKNLTHLYTNYTSINITILQRFCVGLGDKLEKLTLSIERDVRGHVIPTSTWTNFCRRCPNTKVVLYLYVCGPFYDICLGLVKGIPLNEVYAISCDCTPRRDDMQGQIAVLLRHIAKNYATSIESLTLHLDRNPNLDDVMFEVLTKCRRLRHLNLNCKLNVGTVERICRLQTQGTVDLHSLSLNIHGLTEREWRQLNTVRVGLVDAIRGDQ